MSEPTKMYVDCKCRMTLIEIYNRQLQQFPRRRELFSQSCFGHYLGLTSSQNDPLLVHMMLQMRYHPEDAIHDVMYFRVGEHQVHFGAREFCLISGLRFGHRDIIEDTDVRPLWMQRVFPGYDVLYIESLNDMVVEEETVLGLSDEDVVRVYLLFMLEAGFLGRGGEMVVPMALVHMVENYDEWNRYPWGSYVWDPTIDQLQHALERRQNSGKPRYSLMGFTFAFKIWIYETFPFLRSFADPTDRLPRAVAWNRKKSPTWKSCLALIRIQKPEHHPRLQLIPTLMEMQEQWWIDSEAYFAGEQANVSPVRIRRGRHRGQVDSRTSQRVQWSTRWGEDVTGDPSWHTPEPTGWKYPVGSPVYSSHSPPQWESRVDVLEGHYRDHEHRLTKIEEYDFLENQQRQKDLATKYANLESQMAYVRSQMGHHGPSESFGLSHVHITTHSGPSAYHAASPFPVDQFQDPPSDFPTEPVSQFTEPYKTPIERVQKKSTRIKFPGPSKKSPYVDPPSSSKPEVREEYTVRQLYGMCRIPASMYLPVWPQWEINREWWGQLLGMTDAGWFDNSHINAWVLTLMEDRLEDAPWTIQSPEFFNYLTGKSGISGGAPEADGTTKPFPGWWSIRQVLIPINVIDRHWVLGELDLDSMVFTIYDTYNITDYSKILKDKIKTFRMLLKDFLRALNDVERAKNYKKFHAQFDTNIPQQEGDMGDCGVWVCKFMQQRINGERPHGGRDMAASAKEFRDDMAKVFYSLAMVKDR